MNEITKGHVGVLAFNVALEQAKSDGGPGITSKEQFDALVAKVGAEIERAVEAVLSGKAGAAPAKAQRKARGEAKATGSAKVSPEEMREFLSKRGAPTSLTVIASLLGCSKGVAERAIEALGDAVRREKAESVGKGKPPMLYSLA